jgi:hypothetical protein
VLDAPRGKEIQKPGKNFHKKFCDFFAVSASIDVGRLTLVVVWVGGGFINVKPPLFQGNQRLP